MAPGGARLLQRNSVKRVRFNSYQQFYGFLDSFNHSLLPRQSRSLGLMDVQIYARFSCRRFMLLSGVLCVSSQGREESGLGSKLTINNTLPEQRTRSNISTPSSLLPPQSFFTHSFHFNACTPPGPSPFPLHFLQSFKTLTVLSQFFSPCIF